MIMANYYPLAKGNEWEYIQNDGTRYTNTVVSVTGNNYRMHNSAANSTSIIQEDGDRFYTDALEPNNFQLWLKNDVQPGEQWEIKFAANGLDCILMMTVKETGIQKEVEGKRYEPVIVLEAENKMIVNGSLLSLQFFTQYFYANGIGLILTTSSAGDSHKLASYKLV
jgi:hypothetical protein